MNEQHLVKFKLPMIENLSLVNAIVCMGYNKTGNKFQVNFNGSKGYLSHVEISCEGRQEKRNNIIWIERMKTKKGTLMSKMISIFYSEAGIRVEVEGEQPKDETVKKQTCAEAQMNDDDDLPF